MADPYNDDDDEPDYSGPLAQVAAAPQGALTPEQMAMPDNIRQMFESGRRMFEGANFSEMEQRQKAAIEQKREALRRGRETLMAQKPDNTALLLALAQGFLSPTKTGSFFESLGNAGGAAIPAVNAMNKQKLDREQGLAGYDLKNAELEGDAAKSEYDMLLKRANLGQNQMRTAAQIDARRQAQLAAQAAAAERRANQGWTETTLNLSEEEAAAESRRVGTTVRPGPNVFRINPNLPNYAAPGVRQWKGAPDPEKETWSNTPRPGFDNEGNPVMLQTSNTGKTRILPMPEGVKPSHGGTSRIDAGTHYIILDREGNEIGVVPKNVAGAAAERERGKAEGEQVAGAPALITTAEQSIRVLNRALEHPALKSSTGWGGVFPALPGSPRADFNSIAEQIEGRTFLEAFNSLRGGGAITEAEGQKATAAMARLKRTQSEAAYREALEELRGILETGISRARDAVRRAEQARQQPPGGQRPAAPTRPAVPPAAAPPAQGDGGVWSGRVVQ